MSNFDRNAAPWSRGYARTGADVDQGLRAFMLGVYNHMSIGLALTGLFALGAFNMLAVTDQVTTHVVGSHIYLTDFGAAIYPEPAALGDHVRAAGVRPVLLVQDQQHGGFVGAQPVLRLCGGDGRVAVVDPADLYRRLGVAGLLHHRGVLRRAEPLRLHDEAQPVGDGLVPDDGRVRPRSSPAW